MFGGYVWEILGCFSKNVRLYKKKRKKERKEVFINANRNKFKKKSSST